MMGIDSCGMLISAVHTEEGKEKLHLLMVDRPHPRRREAVLIRFLMGSPERDCPFFLSGKEGFFMPLTVNLYYTGEGDAARAFAEEMTRSGTVAAIRSEPGCLRYEYFFPMDDPHTVLLIDSWASQEAVDAHHRTPMMRTIAELREKYDLHMRVERFVPDELPQADRTFVRE